MTQLHTVKFLKSFTDTQDALIQLKDKYGICVNFHSIYPNLVQFKYDQINSPTAHDIVRECRGLILDMDNDWNVIAFPFKRFFSNREHHADKIDWKTAKYWEKIDGSLMFMYFYRDRWEIASSGLPDARGVTGDKVTTFADLFWNIWSENDYTYPNDINCTYMFEMTSPLTQVLVPHTENKLRFIGMRNLTTMEEVSIDSIIVNWDRVKSFPVTSIEDAEKMCDAMNPMEQEGFVITDSKFNRVKLKSPQYAAISHLGLTREEIIEKGLNLDRYDGNTQERWMLKVILVNEHSEFLTYYPQYTQMHQSIYAKYVKLIADMNTLYDSVKDITNQFDYASKVKDHPLSGVFFQLKAGRMATVAEGVKSTDPAKLLKILKGK